MHHRIALLASTTVDIAIYLVLGLLWLLVLSALVATNQPTIVGLCRSSCVTIFFLFFGREKQRNFYLFGFNFFSVFLTGSGAYR